jgi:hypothetical protein
MVGALARLTRAALIAAGIVAAAGCATFQAPVAPPVLPEQEPAVAAEAQAALARLRTANAPLKSFKGIGRLSIRQQDALQLDERIAWVGAEPLKLSVVLFAAGFPAVRLASDGEWLYYQEAPDPGVPVKKIRASDPDLKRLLSISVQTSDVVSLLCGRVPLKEHDGIRMLPVASTNGYVLFLLKSQGGYQKIFLDEKKAEARQTEVYAASGRMLFQANFMEMQLVNGYRVPRRLVVSNPEGAVAQLVIERYWPDVPVTESMFALDVSPGR